jgi:hypothetical protein
MYIACYAISTAAVDAAAAGRHLATAATALSSADLSGACPMSLGVAGWLCTLAPTSFSDSRVLDLGARPRACDVRHLKSLNEGMRGIRQPSGASATHKDV